MIPEWKGSIDSALAVVHCGWRTEAERIVLQSAENFIRQVRDNTIREAIRDSTCRTCGHNPLDK